MSEVRIAIVLGGGLGGMAEYHVACEMVAAAGARAVYIAVNGAGCVMDPLHHWASQHIDNLYDPSWDWARKREANGYGSDYVRWCVSQGGNVDRVLKWKGGSSGWLGVGVGLEGVGCDGAIACGIPMDPRPNPYNPLSKDGWGAYARFRHRWEKPQPEILAKIPDLKDRLRSMSGYTRKLYGPPTVEWIRGLTGLGRAA